VWYKFTDVYGGACCFHLLLWSGRNFLAFRKKILPTYLGQKFEMTRFSETSLPSSLWSGRNSLAFRKKILPTYQGQKFEMTRFPEMSVNKSTSPRSSGDDNLVQNHPRENVMSHPFGNTFDFHVNSSCHFGGFQRWRLAESNT